MEKPKNPPAFPCETPNEIFSGMTLRDYFAAKAMQAVIIAAMTNNEVAAEFNAEPSATTSIVKTALLFADAMLAERQK